MLTQKSIKYMKSEHLLCVMEQLWAGGSRHHLLRSVAPALHRSALLHRLFVRLLPAAAALAHALLLWEDLVGRASGRKTGEHAG